MTYYPWIAKLKYKDKNIDTTYVIRIRKIVFDSYECERCGLTASFTKLRHIYMDSYNKMLVPESLNKLKFSETFGVHLPIGLADSKQNCHCPSCYDADNPKEWRKLTLKEKLLYKFYTRETNLMLNTAKILNLCMCGRWKKDSTFARDSATYNSYGKSWEDVREWLEYATRGIERTKKELNVNYEIEINKDVTEDMLDERYIEYLQRKAIKNL